MNTFELGQLVRIRESGYPGSNQRGWAGRIGRIVTIHSNENFRNGERYYSVAVMGRSPIPQFFFFTEELEALGQQSEQSSASTP